MSGWATLSLFGASNGRGSSRYKYYVQDRAQKTAGGTSGRARGSENGLDLLLIGHFRLQHRNLSLIIRSCHHQKVPLYVANLLMRCDLGLEAPPPPLVFPPLLFFFFLKIGVAIVRKKPSSPSSSPPFWHHHLQQQHERRLTGWRTRANQTFLSSSSSFPDFRSGGGGRWGGLKDFKRRDQIWQKCLIFRSSMGSQHYVLYTVLVFIYQHVLWGHVWLAAHIAYGSWWGGGGWWWDTEIHSGSHHHLLFSFRLSPLFRKKYHCWSSTGPNINRKSILPIFFGKDSKDKEAKSGVSWMGWVVNPTFFSHFSGGRIKWLRSWTCFFLNAFSPGQKKSLKLLCN